MAVPGRVVMATPVQQGMVSAPHMSLPPGAQMGMPAGAQMGMPIGTQMGMPVGPHAGMPAAFAMHGNAPFGYPGQASAQMPTTLQVQAPKGLAPGEMFTVAAPDGQQLEVPVPEDAEPGATFTVSYTPLNPVAAPTVVGMPVGMSMGMPGISPLGAAALEYAAVMELDSERQDRQHSEIGWVLYCVGWALCLCCGPVGPIFWFGVACMHWCRPKAERERLPRERAMAVVSLCTGAVGTAIALLLSMALTAHMVGVHRAHEGQQSGYNREYDSKGDGYENWR